MPPFAPLDLSAYSTLHSHHPPVLCFRPPGLGSCARFPGGVLSEKRTTCIPSRFSVSMVTATLRPGVPLQPVTTCSHCNKEAGQGRAALLKCAGCGVAEYCGK
jgi:hypothetical protein